MLAADLVRGSRLPAGFAYVCDFCLEPGRRMHTTEDGTVGVLCPQPNCRDFVALDPQPEKPVEPADQATPKAEGA
jgi:hypothetical protein